MKRRTDEEISAPLYAYDADIRAQYGCFAGVDEAGRGPLCGPVCVAACILDPEAPVYGINDSKKLTEKKREALFEQIIEKALAIRSSSSARTSSTATTSSTPPWAGCVRPWRGWTSCPTSSSWTATGLRQG